MAKYSFSLKVKSGPGSCNGFVVVSQAALTFGRLDSNDCVLKNDPGISRKHFEIHFKNDQCWIKDLGSRNGTYLNDHSIDSSKLKENDEIRIGNTTLIASINSDQKQPSTTTNAGTKLEPRTRLIVQENETTRIVSDRHFFTAKIPIEMISDDLFIESFNGLPGRAILLASTSGETIVEPAFKDVLKLAENTFLIFAPSCDLQKKIANLLTSNSALYLHHTSSRTQFVDHLKSSFDCFRSPAKFLEEYRERPQELANALMIGIDLAVCQSETPETATAVFEKKHASWLGQLITAGVNSNAEIAKR